MSLQFFTLRGVNFFMTSRVLYFSLVKQKFTEGRSRLFFPEKFLRSFSSLNLSVKIETKKKM